MIKASDFNTNINDAKEEKFSQMVEIQEGFIKENMKKGERQVIWIFSDKEYYNNSLEKTWFEEFANRAETLFVKQGFEIHGIVVCW